MGIIDFISFLSFAMLILSWAILPVGRKPGKDKPESTLVRAEFH